MHSSFLTALDSGFNFDDKQVGYAEEGKSKIKVSATAVSDTLPSSSHTPRSVTTKSIYAASSAAWIDNHRKL